MRKRRAGLDSSEGVDPYSPHVQYLKIGASAWTGIAVLMGVMWRGFARSAGGYSTRIGWFPYLDWGSTFWLLLSVAGITGVGGLAGVFLELEVGKARRWLGWTSLVGTDVILLIYAGGYLHQALGWSPAASSALLFALILSIFGFLAWGFSYLRGQDTGNVYWIGTLVALLPWFALAPQVSAYGTHIWWMPAGASVLFFADLSLARPPHLSVVSEARKGTDETREGTFEVQDSSGD